MIRQIAHCEVCPRRCGALRMEETGAGVCGMGTFPKIARAALHMWEEPCISGTKGSGAVFFSGCGLRCVYCQNTQISFDRQGKTVSPGRLADIFRELVTQGAHNINLVTATHFIDAVLEALREYRPPVPVVFNSSGYETIETLRRLEGWVDVYLPDLKYIRPEVSMRYSGAPDYFQFASDAVLEMVRQTGPPVLNSDGMMERGTLIRHLILPGNTRNSIEVLNWIKENLPDTPVSLMAQYIPCGRASGYAEINRPITKREYQKVLEHLFFLGLDGYVQERTAAKKEYIPSFLLEGVEVSHKKKREEEEQK